MQKNNAPLAEELRPKKLDEIVGQLGILGEGQSLKVAIESNKLPSMILWGPPGVGKTVCVAKLAARARLAGHEAHLISTDTIRAGALDQLNVYADRLGLTLATTAQGDSLDKLVQAAPSDTLVLIDTPAVNPYDPDGINTLIRQINIIEWATILKKVSTSHVAFKNLSPRGFSLPVWISSDVWGACWRFPIHAIYPFAMSAGHRPSPTGCIQSIPCR